MKLLNFKKLLGVFILLAISHISLQAQYCTSCAYGTGPELIQGGDFEDRLFHWSSDLATPTFPIRECGNDRIFRAANPNEACTNSSWAWRTGNDTFLCVNVNNYNAATIWRDSLVSLVAGKTYNFGYRFNPNISPLTTNDSAVVLDLRVNGVTIQTLFARALPDDTSWYNICHTFVAPATDTVVLSIFQTNFKTKDFALDDITLKECYSNPCAYNGSISTSLNKCEASFSVTGTLPNDVSILSTNWSFGDATGGSGNTISHGYETTGTYTACAEVVLINEISKICCVEQYCTTVVIDTLCSSCDFGSMSVLYNLNEECCIYEFSLSASAQTTVQGVLWDFGDGNTTTGSIAEHEFASNGEYTVCGTVVGRSGSSCCSETFCVTIDDDCGAVSAPAPQTNPTNTSMDEPNSSITSDDFTFYPNPAHSDLNISFNQHETERVSLYIVDIQGKRAQTLMSEQTVPQGHQELNFSTAQLSPGIYFLHMEKDGQRTVKKLVIQNR